jgi:ornithine cyclodeaminase/alanine dehydrogenase
MVLMLTRSDVLAVLRLDEVIDRVEAGHRALAEGQAQQPPRTAVELPDSRALLIPMIAASGPDRAVGLKVLTDSPDNLARGLPRQQSVVVLVDPASGGCEAILDGAAVTVLRTAAASAVATRHLANPDAGTLGLVGAGRLAAAHVRAIRHVRPIRTVIVHSRTSSTVERLAAEVRAAGLELVVARTPEEVVRGCDVLCTLTPAPDPIVCGAWLHEGMHLNVVGAPPRPSHREVDTAVLVRSRVIVDDVGVAHAESGLVAHALAAGEIDPARVGTSLGDVIAGHATGRRSPADITTYVSVGVGIQDVVTARLAVDLARTAHLGINVDLAA